jgi:VanZ family protein
MSVAPARRSGTSLLAWVWTALIAYATLFPFTGWRWPPGADPDDLLVLRWPRWWGGFDVGANLVGYLPIGMLVGLAMLSRGRGKLAAAAGGGLAGVALSYGLEVTQHLLPQRVPSLMDWVLNSVGALLGGLLAVALGAAGLPPRLRRAHDRWLGAGGSGAIVLLLLWPVALLFPAPVPLGLGQVGGLLRELAIGALTDVPWAEAGVEWLQAEPIQPSLSRLSEGLAVVLGLLSPCLIAFVASRAPWRRVGWALGAPLVAVAATTLSTALNFGPDHAFAWHTPGVVAALSLGTVIALSLVWVGPRTAAGLALVALTGLVMLVHQAPTDPYFAESLQGWEQGRFIRFHGLARWIGWLWPYAAMAWLLARPRQVD